MLPTTTSVCFLPLSAFKASSTAMSPDITARLVSAFVLSRLDYCNSVLAGLPQSTIVPLQRFQNAAARLIMFLWSRDQRTLVLRQHIAPGLRHLHWLQVKHQVRQDQLFVFIQIPFHNAVPIATPSPQTLSSFPLGPRRSCPHPHPCTAFKPASSSQANFKQI